MDIENILNSLGLDLKNPEAKRGALEAIDAILASRQTDALDGLSGMSGEQDIELDPDLIQPSIKNQSQSSSDDIEINDEEDILKDIKHNDSDEPTASNADNSGDNDDSSDSQSSESSSDNNAGSSDSSQEQDADEAEAEEDSEENEGSNESSDDADGQDDSSAADGEEVADANDDEGEATEGSEAEDSEDAAEESDEDAADSIAGENRDEEGSEESEEGEPEFDEDDLVDDSMKDVFDDKELKSKHEARKIKRERTLQAAKQALADAKSKKKSAPLIRELEKAIDALESLKEAIEKTLKDISDEEFNMLVNRVFDAIDALGDSGLTYSSDEERKIKAQEIKADLDDKKTQAELSAEDVAQIRAETQAIKAREKEAAKYQRRSSSSFKGFQDFLSSLYRAIALQVTTSEEQDDTWSALNRRYNGTGVLQQGKRLNELPNKKIPVIDFYFDQSGSWSSSDIDVGKRAVEALVEMEEKGQIKINVYYFANNVHNDAVSARREGGTGAWNEIVKNVIATGATNVIIMTDSDMEDFGIWSYDPAMRYTVPGYVWYLWRDGDNAPRLPRDLKGRGGTQQFSFTRGDV